jgi:signal transduction histidine kinase
LPIINAVSNELTLLFSNLIDNALKYNTLQDNIKLQIKYANVAQDHVFEIIDNGIGIDNEYFETIFIPFKRLHARSEYPGTGLGLAIVEKIIKKYKGRVSVSSSLGEGSKFTFTIPVK